MSRLRSATLTIGDLAPPLALPDLDGSLVALPDLLAAGPLLLVFAPGSWSPNTRRQVSDLLRTYDTFREIGLGVALVVTESPRTARRLLPEDGPCFPILIDEDRDVAREYGVFRAVSLDGIRVTRPAAFLLDPDGALRFVYVGQRDADVPEIDALLRLGSWLVTRLRPPGAVAPAPHAVPAAVEGAKVGLGVPAEIFGLEDDATSVVPQAEWAADARALVEGVIIGGGTPSEDQTGSPEPPAGPTEVSAHPAASDAVARSHAGEDWKARRSSDIPPTGEAVTRESSERPPADSDSAPAGAGRTDSSGG